MIFEPLPIPGAFRIRLRPVADGRGFFARRFCAETFRDHGLEKPISCSARFRSIFGAEPCGACTTRLRRIWRPSSSAAHTRRRFRRDGRSSHRGARRGGWHGEEITAEIAARCSTFLTGVAHGFQTLMERYRNRLRDHPFLCPGADRGIRFDDPALAIDWPISEAVISERDRALPLLAEVS